MSETFTMYMTRFSGEHAKTRIYRGPAQLFVKVTRKFIMFQIFKRIFHKTFPNSMKDLKKQKQKQKGTISRKAASNP